MFALTAEVIPEVWALVLLFTKVATDVLAVVTSESVASDPEVRPAPVKVRVVAAQTSEATDAREVRVLDENAQIDAGSEAARELEAEATTALVFALTAEVIPEVWALVLLFTKVATEVEAFVIADPSDDDALPTMVLVFELTALVIPEV